MFLVARYDGQFHQVEHLTEWDTSGRSQGCPTYWVFTVLLDSP